jgi:hypothetical protein
MKIALIVFAAAGCLSGCMMPMHYYRPGNTLAQFNKDKQECIYDAEKYTANTQDPFAAFGEQTTLLPQCMKAKGYTAEP